MSERDANNALAAAALAHGLRVLDPLEQTQFMPIYDRRRRQAEARGLQIAGMVADEVQAQVDAVVDALVVKTGWPDFREGNRKYRLSAHEIAQQDGFPDNEN
jgi:hypothetical protein